MSSAWPRPPRVRHGAPRAAHRGRGTGRSARRARDRALRPGDLGLGTAVRASGAGDSAPCIAHRVPGAGDRWALDTVHSGNVCRGSTGVAERPGDKGILKENQGGPPGAERPRGRTDMRDPCGRGARVSPGKHKEGGTLAGGTKLESIPEVGIMGCLGVQLLGELERFPWYGARRLECNEVEGGGGNAGIAPGGRLEVGVF